MLYGRVRRGKNDVYAFIKRNGGQNDVFLHRTDVETGVLPPEGALVMFNLGLFRDKIVARNARVVSVESAAVTNVEA